MAIRQLMSQAQKQDKKRFKYGQTEYEIVTSKKSQGSKPKTRAKKSSRKGP